MDSPLSNISIERSIDDEEAPFLDSDATPKKSWYRPSSRATPALMLQAAILIFLCSILVLFAALSRRPSDQECFAQLNVRSPAVVALEMHEVDFANGFSQQSPFRGTPTPELEERWQDLWNVGGISVPAADLPSLNRSAKSGGGYMRVADEAGGGYAAMIEVYHQLHCLNLIRQYTYLDHYDEAPVGLQMADRENRMHVDHCIETLRLSLMCRPDVTPLLVELDDTAPMGRRADFHSHHKCVRFDKLTKWMSDHKAFT